MQPHQYHLDFSLISTRPRVSQIFMNQAHKALAGIVPRARKNNGRSTSQQQALNEHKMNSCRYHNGRHAATSSMLTCQWASQQMDNIHSGTYWTAIEVASGRRSIQHLGVALQERLLSFSFTSISQASSWISPGCTCYVLNGHLASLDRSATYLFAGTLHQQCHVASHTTASTRF